MVSTAVVPRATVSQICANRQITLEKFRAAHEQIELANAAIAAAFEQARLCSPVTGRYNIHLTETKQKFLRVIDAPSAEAYMDTARRWVDCDIWSHLMEITDLERLMDKKSKDQFNQQLVKDPPEATVDNVFATITQLVADADMIFKRGVAECFSSLDRRFRSHDGWKIGARVILTRAFNEFGMWNFHRNERDTLRDIERAFLVMDGKPLPKTYAASSGTVDEEKHHLSIIQRIDAARQNGGLNPRQSLVEDEYFRVRIFENGNAHIWFKRDDLLDKVNQLLGDYYGAPIPEDRDAEDDGGLFTPKTSLAKNYGFYPSPAPVVGQVIERARLYRRPEDAPLMVLEPSAGTASLARAAADAGAIVDCVEIQHELASHLRTAGRYRRVYETDFLRLQPDKEHLYDRVIMNPPFDLARDVDHVMHALQFLKPDGILVSVMSASTEFRETRKTIAFREHIKRLGGVFTDLPPRSFSEMGTNVNTIILTVRMDGRSPFW